jgi:hypothetical protein
MHKLTVLNIQNKIECWSGKRIKIEIDDDKDVALLYGNFGPLPFCYLPLEVPLKVLERDDWITSMIWV